MCKNIRLLNFFFYFFVIGHNTHPVVIVFLKWSEAKGLIKFVAWYRLTCKVWGIKHGYSQKVFFHYRRALFDCIWVNSDCTWNKYTHTPSFIFIACILCEWETVFVFVMKRSWAKFYNGCHFVTSESWLKQFGFSGHVLRDLPCL